MQIRNNKDCSSFFVVKYPLANRTFITDYGSKSQENLASQTWLMSVNNF